MMTETTLEQKTIHFVIASGQIFQNVIPILVYSPDTVIVATSHDMQNASDRLVAFIQNQKFKEKNIEVIPLYGLPEDLNEIIEWFNHQLVTREEFKNSFITFNITGGTKLMSLGMLVSSRDIHNRNVIYINTARKIQEVIDPITLISKKETIPPVLQIEPSLQSAGYQIIEQSTVGPIKNRSNLTYKLASRAKDSTSLIGKLNSRLWTPDNYNNKSPQDPLLIEFKGKPSKQDREILDLMVELGLMIETKELNTYEIVNKSDVKKYLQGGWLEEFVYLKLESLNCDDLRLGVKVKTIGGQGARSEFDVVAAKDNHFLICECKTTKSVYLNQGPKRESDKLEKRDLETLDSNARHYLGDQCSRWYVSAYERDTEFNNKAKDRRIKTIYPKDFDKIDDLFLKS